MTLPHSFERFASQHSLWTSHTRIIAAVSGGSDSVAMLFLLHDLHERGAVRIESIAHLDHQVRSDSRTDQDFCRQLADRLGHRYVTRTIDVPAFARKNKQSLELAGRTARRRFFDDVRRALDADLVATAHTQDDQVETILLRLLRGAATRGLRGILPARSFLIRPVLFATRAELRDYLRQRGESWREDSTNADLRNIRNRVRHELLPYLERHFNPAARRALLRAADIAGVEDELLSRIAAAAAAVHIERDGDRVVMDATRLRLLPDALRRRVIHHSLVTAGNKAPSFDDVLRIAEMAEVDGTTVDLARVRAEHFRGKVVLIPSSGSVSRPRPTPFCVALSVPGIVRTTAGWLVEASGADRPEGHPGQPDVAHIDAARVTGGLVVRNRRPGDRIRPLGLRGRKKLQDVLVDRKVSRHERDVMPVVTDESGRIVWLAGHVLSEEFRVTEGTKAVIILKLRRE